jgi:hypothetical protein
MGPMISIALIHAPVLTYNGAPWIYMGFFAHQYLEILKVVSTEIQQASLLNWMSVGSISPFGRYHFTKLLCYAQYASWSLWMTVVLRGWKFSTFVALFGGTTDTAACCTSCTRNVYELTSIVAPVSYIFTKVHLCPFACSVTVWIGTCCLKPFLCWELNSDPWMSLYLLNYPGCWRVNERENNKGNIGRMSGMSCGIF